jgi:hypothetical protein
MFRQKQCFNCYGQGIIRNKTTGRWDVCACGRRLDSVAAGKLAKQAKLDERLEEIKAKGW